MSAGHLKVDYDKLGELERNLDRAVAIMDTELESATVLAAHVGDAGLGAKVIAFGQSWNKHRFDIRDDLAFLRDSVKQISTELEGVDVQLASGLTSGGSAGQAGGSTGGGRGRAV